MDNNLVNPIKVLALNQCPKCLGSLKLKETETVESTINKYGLITDSEESFELQLECIVCHTVYNANKKGNRYYIDHGLRRIEKPKIDYGYNPFQI